MDGVGRLTDWISLGVLTSSLPREAVDAAVAAHDRGAKRSDGKLPPHVMVYFAVAMALFAAEDYEEVAARLSQVLAGWGCWDSRWSVPTSGGITQARVRLGVEPLRELFDQVAVPVADQLTRGAFLGPWRLMSIDGFEWDAPDTPGNVEAFGHRGAGGNASAFVKLRVVTIAEAASHAVVDVQMEGTSVGEQPMARHMYPRLDPGWLLLADRNFYSFDDWKIAAATGAQLLWRVRADIRLPVIEALPDGSYRSVLISPQVHKPQLYRRLVAAAGRGEFGDPDQVVQVRVVEYTVPDRNGTGETIRLITTIGDPAVAGAEALAVAYHERWEHETGNDQIKTHLRGPGRVLRSKSPDMVRQEIYGYLLAHHAICALICRAATEADIDPDRVKFVRTVRVVRRKLADPAAFSP